MVHGQLGSVFKMPTQRSTMMSPSMNRRTLLKESLAATAAGALAWHSTADNVFAEDRATETRRRERHDRPGQCLADGPDRQAEGKPDVVGRQSAHPLYAQPRSAVRVQPGCPLQHRREDHGDLGVGGAARHQHAFHAQPAARDERAEEIPQARRQDSVDHLPHRVPWRTTWKPTRRR